MKALVLFFYLLSGLFIFAQTSTDSLVTLNKKDQLNKTDLSIWDVFQQRRSVRKYKSDSVPKEDIIKIIDAARMAPTSGNQQPWKFLVI